MILSDNYDKRSRLYKFEALAEISIHGHVNVAPVEGESQQPDHSSQGKVPLDYDQIGVVVIFRGYFYQRTVQAVQSCAQYIGNDNALQYQTPSGDD